MTADQFLILPRPEYDRLYHAAFAKPKDITLRALEREWEELSARLLKNLGAHWTESCYGDADFALGDDWQESFHHCGGIYSDEILCPLYADVLADTLATMPHAERWSYHTSVELRSQRVPDGQFFIRGGEFYAPKTRGFDYRAVFSKA